MTLGRALPLAGAATSEKFVATKDVFCREKSMLVATKLLSRQTTFFVATNTGLSSFVATNILLSRQTTFFSRDKHVFVKFGRNKYTFVPTNDVFSCDKHVFVMFVATKCFVATKVILVAAPTVDTLPTLATLSLSSVPVVVVISHQGNSVVKFMDGKVPKVERKTAQSRVPSVLVGTGSHVVVLPPTETGGRG